MEQYKIDIYPTAQNDLRNIVEYLNTFSPDSALRYYDYVIEKIGTLTSMPERCPLVRDKQLRMRGYRSLLVKNYIIFYVVKEKTVEIRRILYAKRQYGTLL